MGIRYKFFIYLLNRIFALPSTPSIRYLHGMYDEEPDASYSSNPNIVIRTVGLSCMTMLIQLTRSTRFYAENQITVLSQP